MQTAYQPSTVAPATADPMRRYADSANADTLPPQTQKTIADLLNAKGTDLAWYTGSWTSTMAEG